MKLFKATELDLQRITQFYQDVIAHTEHMDTYARWVYGQHPTDELIKGYIQKDAMYYYEENGVIVSALAVTRQGEDYHGAMWSISSGGCGCFCGTSALCCTEMAKAGRRLQGNDLCGRIERKDGKKAVRLDAFACNTPAHRLYESLGFQKRDQRRWYADNVSRAQFFLYELVLRDAHTTNH